MRRSPKTWRSARDMVLANSCAGLEIARITQEGQMEWAHLESFEFVARFTNGESVAMLNKISELCGILAGRTDNKAGQH